MLSRGCTEFRLAIGSGVNLKFWKRKPKPDSRTDLPSSLREFDKRFRYTANKEKVAAAWVAVSKDDGQLVCGGDPLLVEVLRKQFAK